MSEALLDPLEAQLGPIEMRFEWVEQGLAHAATAFPVTGWV